MANAVSLTLLGCILYFKLRETNCVRPTPRRVVSGGVPKSLPPGSSTGLPTSVARDLLGKALVRRNGQAREALIITETEGYLGPHDLACHSARGRTPRTEVIYRSTAGTDAQCRHRP